MERETVREIRSTLSWNVVDSSRLPAASFRETGGGRMGRYSGGSRSSKTSSARTGGFSKVACAGSGQWQSGRYLNTWKSAAVRRVSFVSRFGKPSCISIVSGPRKS